jgi:hypothetical protein
MDTTRLNLILSTPVIPKENILLIEGIYDLLAERQPIEELWQKWQQPEIWRLPHGHVTTQFVLGLMGRVLRWLAPRLDKPFSPDRGTPPTNRCSQQPLRFSVPSSRRIRTRAVRSNPTVGGCG